MMSVMRNCQKIVSAVLLLHTSGVFQQVTCQPIQYNSKRQDSQKVDEATLNTQFHESLGRLQSVNSIQDILQRHTGTPQLTSLMQIKVPHALSNFDIRDYLSHGRLHSLPSESSRTSLKGKVLDEDQVLRMFTSTAGRPAGVGPPFGFYDARLLQPVLSPGGRLPIHEALHGKPHQNHNYERYIEIKEPSIRTPSLAQDTRTVHPLAGVTGSIPDSISKGLLRLPGVSYVNVPTGPPAVHETHADQLLPLIVPQEVQMIQALQTLASLQTIQRMHHQLQAVASASQAKARGIKFEHQHTMHDPYLALLLGSIRKNGE